MAIKTINNRINRLQDKIITPQADLIEVKLITAYDEQCGIKESFTLFIDPNTNETFVKT